MSNISGFSDLSNKNDEKNEEGNEFYTGGNDSRGGGSGLNVLDPVDRLKASASSQHGSTDGARKLTIYKNGIIIDDGPFRPRDDARTIEIMSELTAGRVPKEMRTGNGDGDVEVVLVDKQSETYEIPFGSENWRGGAKGSVIGNTGDATTEVFNIDEIDDEDVRVDSSPSTTIQLKWIDGTKMKFKVNHSHTVRDILRLLKKKITTNAASFSLSAGYPPTSLTDLDVTVKDANLIGTSIQCVGSK